MPLVAPVLHTAKVLSLWRCLDMASPKVVEQMFRCGESSVLGAMARLAVDRSGGQLLEFSGRRFVSSELLNYIGDRYLIFFCFSTLRTALFVCA